MVRSGVIESRHTMKFVCSDGRSVSTSIGPSFLQFILNWDAGDEPEHQGPTSPQSA
jgi:hypothetical protein